MAFFNIDRRFGLQTIHKCGSSAIQNALPKSGLWFSQIDVEQYMRMKDRYAFVRDPHHRMVSTYRMYVQRGCSWPYDLSGLEPFVLSVCSLNVKDPHTLPQWWHLNKCGFTPTEIIRWDFKRVADLLGIDKVEPYNGTVKKQPVEWTDAALAAFKQHYADDIAMWNDGVDACA